MERPSARALSGSLLAPKSTSTTAARISRCQGLSSPSPISVLISKDPAHALQGRLDAHATPRSGVTHLSRGYGRATGDRRSVLGQGGGGFPADVGYDLSRPDDAAVLAEPQGEPAYPFAVRCAQDHPHPALSQFGHFLARVVLRHPAPVR